jgi:hypothetical protein
VTSPHSFTFLVKSSLNGTREVNGPLPSHKKKKVDDSMSREFDWGDLSANTVSQIREQAQRMGVELSPRLKKDEMIAMVRSARLHGTPTPSHQLREAHASPFTPPHVPLSQSSSESSKTSPKIRGSRGCQPRPKSPSAEAQVIFLFFAVIIGFAGFFAVLLRPAYVPLLLAYWGLVLIVGWRVFRK